MDAYPAPRLPAELSDAIIDYLRADKYALRACSLVCRNWLPRARYRKFETVALDTGNCGNLLALLERTPDIATFPKDVTLRAHRQPLGCVRRPGVSQKTLATIVSLFPSVEILHFVGIEVHPAFAAVFRHRCARLHTLDFKQARVRSLGLLFELLAVLPSLRTVRYFCLQFSGWQDVPIRAEDMDIAGPHQASLAELVCEGRNHDDPVTVPLLRWLVARRLHAGLRALALPNIARDDDRAILIELLRETGPNLRGLALGFAQQVHFGSDRALAAALARCTGVRALALTEITLLRPNKWVVGLLRDALATQAVEQLTLRYHADGADGDCVRWFVDWRGLVQTLPDTRRFPALRLVTFSFRNAPRDIEEAICVWAEPLWKALHNNGVRMQILHLRAAC
ncbi:hypothetical protein PsYK624_083440 [Phanerochaete sordida]|uniref:F-box domain-containing protein n=1 Tax=Phanerochaete sordida TaxID=48140 RepID=A0A9P3GCE7_9APHY|nr:hypothetical protein PsYK624_083440 [Phanerochaete sordida]